jgi:hypothetical protein
MTSTTHCALAAVRSRAAAGGHPRDGRPVPRWAELAAHLVPLVTLPAALWRIALALGASMGLEDADVGPGTTIYNFALSAVSEGAALLTFGLVRPWGERAPGWIPVIGGRRLAPAPVIAAAVAGALALQAIWAFAFFQLSSGQDELRFTGPGWRALLVACYAPNLLWAPLLGAVTWAYWRRRCRS